MEPDWELIEKIQSIAKGEVPDVEQDIPEAPNLELLEHENKSKKSDEDQIENDSDGENQSLEITETDQEGDPFSSVENEWSKENSKPTDEDDWGVPWE